MSRQVSPDCMGGWRKNFRSANKEIALPRLVLCWDSGLIGQGKAPGECKAQRLGSGTLFSQGINSSPWLHPYHVEHVGASKASG